MGSRPMERKTKMHRMIRSDIDIVRSQTCGLVNKRVITRLKMFFFLPPFPLIRDFGKQNTRGNVSKISVSLACYRQIGSKSTNYSH